MTKPFICRQCPRECGVLRGEQMGACGVGPEPRLARIALHFDEEPCVSGTRGSGAAFFSGCALGCAYCQNAPISHGGFGREQSREQLRSALERLIAEGAHNVNLVNPTHYSHVLEHVLEQPLGAPVVWNSSGYEKADTLKRFEGKVQIYLPDLKYVDEDGARRYSNAPDYFSWASKALIEMHRQVGDPVLDEDGIIRGGLIVRHLILPGRARQSMQALDWIAANLPGAYVSLMAQYVPFARAGQMPEINRPITRREYDRVVDHMLAIGLAEGYVQELSSSDERYIPAFDLTGVE